MPSTKPVSAWRRYAQEGWLIGRLGLANLLQRWWQFLLIVGLGITAVLADRGEWDFQLLQLIRQPDNDAFTQTARTLSEWGDVYWPVLGSLALFVAGVKLGRPRWRQITWACLLAMLASGIIVNLFRPTLGRPRPYSKLPPGFYGPHLESEFHSLPSGHATTAFAAAAAVTAVLPWLGAPGVIIAGGVSWSRMQLNRHHPLDVMTGAALGTLIGLCFGSGVEGARFRLRKKPRG